MKDSQNLFEGLKVVDAASFIAGPSAATIMADYGAEVIKIEPPEVGDSLRWLITNGRMPEGKENYCWELTSRNKKSLSLNLKEPEALQILKDLVISADVFVTNMPFPVRKKLKITSEEICPLNERLIYASLTGYGEVGPDADRTAYDSMAWWARSGLMDWVRPSDNSPVAWSTPGMGDHPTGMALYGAIVTALYKRQLTGKGSEVSTSLMANGAWANGVFIQAALMGVEFADRSEPLPRHPLFLPRHPLSLFRHPLFLHRHLLLRHLLLRHLLLHLLRHLLLLRHLRWHPTLLHLLGHWRYRGHLLLLT